MMKALRHKMHRNLMLAMAVSSLSVLTACSDDPDSAPNSGMNDNNSYEYQITLKNLSYQQPFSPAAVIVDVAAANYWSVGTMASPAIEKLAESGDNSDLLDSSNEDAFYAESGLGLILPGASESFTVRFDSTISAGYLSLATMLVNTNDAFAGAMVDLSVIEAGASHKISVMTYDAGTEANSELAGTIPGPADGGEGYNSIRDDVDYVAMHPGVVANTAEHVNSVLNSTHRFDAPVAELIIKRMQ